MSIKKTVILITTVTSIFVISIGILILDFLRYDLDYLLNWNIFIPKYENRNELINISGFQYLTYFEILTYSEDDINEMITKEIFIPIKTDSFTELYEEYVTNYYEEKLNQNEKEIFNKYIDNNMFNENNYYMFRVDSKRERRFILNILNIQNNKVYSLYTSP